MNNNLIKNEIKKSFSLKNLSNPQMIVMSFLLVILTGTILLMLPWATVEKGCMSFIDALFTSTSAVCVTGLIVRDTPYAFTYFGKIVIMLLFQIGGLGLMTLSTLLVFLLGKKLTLSDRVMMQDVLGVLNLENIAGIIKYIISLTFLFEAVGAIILMINYRVRYNYSFFRAMWYGLFHSISAFCNAGFSLYSKNFENFHNDFIINIVIMFLIVSGGIGFVVLINLIHWSYDKLRKQRKVIPKFSLQTKAVFKTTAYLILIPALLFLILEWTNTFSGFSFFDKITASFFQSITTRTAGFNTVPIGEMRSASLFLMMLLMFIGASPGGTGGGIKTTTFVVLLMTYISHLRDRDKVELFKRSISSQLVHRALSIIMIYGIMLLAATFLLLISESMIFNKPFTFEQLLFEVFSAQGTVGLSTGITGDLSWLGKFIIIMQMFAGRVGALTIVLAMNMKKKEIVSYSYPEESMMLG